MMDDGFIELKRLFDSQVERGARAQAEEICQASRGVDLEDLYDEDPGLAESFVRDSRTDTAARIIMQLFDGCSIGNAKSILAKATCYFDCYHKVRAENIP